MVLFLNINVGQRVVVKVQDQLVPAVVKFKGHLNGQAGRWVGVALEQPLGSHNGCWRGNQYFKCPDKHGLFTHACNVGFPSVARRSRNSYKTRSVESSVEEELFGPVKSSQRDNCISQGYLENVRSLSRGSAGLGYRWERERTFNKSHSVGNYIPCATISKEEPEVYQPYKKRPDYFLSLNSSIPHYRMPHEAQLECLKRGSFNSKSFKQPRFLSV